MIETNSELNLNNNSNTLTQLQYVFANIEKFDKSNVFDILCNFPEQVNQAIKIGQNIKLGDELIESVKSLNNIAILGMGGSAIGGDLLKSYLEAVGYLGNVYISRNYDLPKYIDDTYLILAVSYSGNTEETISAVRSAHSFSRNIICVSTGGTLLDFAIENKYHHILIPSGLQPRFALGYSFFVQLFILIKLGKLNFIENEINKDLYELGDLLSGNVEYYSMENEANAPYQIALSMYNKQVLIYSSDNVLNAINLRWRGQIQENAKHIAYGGYLPEMNHNEINSFVNPKNLVKEQTFVFLLDKLYHPRVIKRFEVIEEILKEQEHNILVIQSHAQGLITRMFDLAYLGDWVSYYLAMINEEDPTPIPLIIKLKDELTK